MVMNRWTTLGTLLFGGVFALFAFWRVDVIDSGSAKAIISAFLFGSYCAIVVFGSDGKRRLLSLARQTFLGVALAFSIAAMFGASPQGYFLAAALGLVLGYTADLWVLHIQLP